MYIRNHRFSLHPLEFQALCLRMGNFDGSKGNWLASAMKLQGGYKILLQ
jgi:hypothetical protein